MMTSYIARSSRWLWVNTTAQLEDAGTPTLEAIDIHHPIFNDVGLDAQGRVDIYDQSVGSGTVSMTNTVDLGNGTLIAKHFEQDVTVIAEWAPGVEFYPGAGQFAGARRMLFCAGTREGNGQGRGEFNLNDEGQTLFVNAIEYMLGNLVREPWVKAWRPDPADGAEAVALALFQWTAGETALLHNVYFGTTPELTEADLVSARVPMTMYYHVPGLEPGMTYYWRVDEVELDGTTHEGDVWTFSVAPLTAYHPQPKDGAKWIEPAGLTLRWSPGQNALSHDVYFGTDEAAVAEGTGDTFQGNQVQLTFDPGVLDPDATYYWRVDEVLLGGTTQTGEVWSFRTLGEGGGLRGLYYANDALSGAPALDRIDPQIDFDWGDATPDPTLPNDNFSVRWVGEIDVPFSETYTFYANTEDGVRLWVNDVQIMDLWQNRRSPTEAKASIDLVGGQRYSIVMEYYDAGGVAVAQLSWESPSTPKEIIPQGAFSPPLRASGPNPASGSVDVTQAPTLSWSAGEEAAQHQVYFGDDPDAVANADTTTAGIYRGQQALDAASYVPGPLEWSKTYYWRIDEVNPANADSPWIGSVWSFTTADFVVVEDFESYDDDIDGGTTVFQTWIDGYENGTGALVGYLEAINGTFCESTIVHGGNQSMPLDYNNIVSPFYSEAERTWLTPQDWTINGVTDLALWFRGNPVSYLEVAPDSITMSASGVDIWGTSDEFRFAYKRLNGNGSIIARVDSVENTNGWAKAGVMIRDSLNADSRFAYLIVSPANGVSFGRRPLMAGTCESSTEAGITAPHWVKLTRTGNTIAAQHSADGVLWVDVTDPDGDPTAVDISMMSNVYIGLAVTSHQPDAVCLAEFSGISTSGGVSGQWQNAEIGIDHPGNSQDDLYVALQDSANRLHVVVHPDPGAVLISDWTEWRIPLSDFSGAGLNLAAIKKMYIGVGDRNNPQPDGAGLLYIDDIRVVKP